MVSRGKRSSAGTGTGRPKRPPRGQAFLVALAAVGWLAPAGPAPGAAVTALAYSASPASTPLGLAGNGDETTVTTDNWSGYVSSYAPGGISAVTGTFSVAHARRSPAGSTLSQWVGVDGWDNTTLLQAGVDVISEGRGVALAEPWWEIVPGPQHLATGVMARPGDTVTVELSETAPGTWSITLTDDTRREAFSTLQAYLGPSTSAEWIVEAATTSSGKPTRLTAYSPAVTFSGLGLSGAQANLTRVVMVQSATAVSVPSDMTANGFRVFYGPGAHHGADATATSPA